LTLIARLDPKLRHAFVGAEERDGHRAVEEALGTGVFDGDDEIKRGVDRLCEVARESLSVVWGAVKGIAKARLSREELDRDEVEDVIGDDGLYTPVLAVQRAHRLQDFIPRDAASNGDGTLAEGRVQRTARTPKKAAKPSATTRGQIRTRRWNDPVDLDHGNRVLVCRYRPRGVRKDAETWDA
jgi:hypothetical protein